MLPPFSEPQSRSPEETKWSLKHNRYEYVMKLIFKKGQGKYHTKRTLMSHLTALDVSPRLYITSFQMIMYNKEQKRLNNMQ